MSLAVLKIFIYGLAKEFSKEGHEVYIVAKRGKNLEQKNVKVFTSKPTGAQEQ